MQSPESDQRRNPTVNSVTHRERDVRKRVVSALLEDLEECDEEEEVESSSEVSPQSPYSSHKSSTLQFTFPIRKVL